MKEYIKESAKKYLKERKEYYLYDIPIYILNSFPEHIDINNIIDSIKDSVPYEFVTGLEAIYVGEFPELKDRKIQAMLKDGAIYLSSFSEHPEVTEDIIFNDIVHELAHSLEDKFYFEIYNDGTIEKEYTAKKKMVVDLLRANGISFYGMGKLFFSDEQVDELDDFLYNKIGYENLIPLTTGLLFSPYSITSVREYFASGFEQYINGEYKYLKEISLALYNKFEELINME